MPSAVVLAADGFETIECLTVVDVLRRGGVRTLLVSVMSTRDVVSAQQVSVTCDCTLDEIDMDDFDYLVLPGGMPGTTHLRADERVCELVRAFAATRHVAAICAAPSILGELGVLDGRRATCFPGFEKTFPAGVFAGPKTVVVDGNIITASAMGQALPFALAVLGDIAGEVAVEKVREGIQLDGPVA
ncbi:DJ-1 family glyoxalase III [Candidatus Collinsella stercoripullorum]|uniref:DJ-1 family glyoxalase III n=1 Tax=Candidatus Collinsella stercoripullorum TaxID=2838522 RepID=UPI001C3AB459|nr:DJ-1 family glyoxalase III [Candidatus Collinsella stercoripullorum]HJA00891.1 DJ-1/PfpI family protein [Candidatus Collinsella stercoripullorum]